MTRPTAFSTGCTPLLQHLCRLSFLPLAARVVSATNCKLNSFSLPISCYFNETALLQLGVRPVSFVAVRIFGWIVHRSIVKFCVRPWHFRAAVVKTCLRPWLCLSQVGVLPKRLNESSWFFGTWASFHPSYTVLKGNSFTSKKKGTSLWNFVLNSGHRQEVQLSPKDRAMRCVS